MITKVIKSAHLGATLDYIYKENKDPEVVTSTCFPCTRDDTYAELKEAIDQRPGIKQPVFHGIVSLPTTDDVDAKTWRHIAQEYATRMGFEHAPYVAIKHHDTDHAHIHIVASRIDLRGQLISDSHDWNRSEQIARALEKKHNLTPVLPSWEVEQRRARQQEYHLLSRHEELSARERMRHAIEASLSRHHATRDVTAFATSLEKDHQVRMVPRFSLDESKVIGVWFEKEGQRVAGSKLAREYSWHRLSQKLDYEPARDLSTLRHHVRTPESSPTVPTVSSTPQRSRHDEGRDAPSFSHAPSPEAHTAPAPTQAQRELTHIQDAVRGTSHLRDWDTWRDALRARQVEVIPKVSVQDHTHVRGMYFAHGETLVPGSQVDRAASYPAISARLGELSSARVQEMYAQVYVPGQGVQSPQVLPVQDRHVSPVPPQDTLSPLVQRLKEADYRLIVDPKTFEGVWQGGVQNVRGERFAVLGSPTTHTSHEREAVLIRLPEGSLLDTSSMTKGMPIALTRDAHGAPILGAPTPTKAPDLTPDVRPERTHRDTLSPLLERLKEADYRLIVDPKTFEGVLQGHVHNERGAQFAVLSSPTTGASNVRDAVLVRLPEGTTWDASSMTKGMPIALTRDAHGAPILGAPMPTRAPDVTPAHTHRDTLTPFIQRLEDANYRVIMEPRTFEGMWHGDVQNAKGERFALLGSSTTDAPNAREAVLVRLPEGTTLDASVMTQGMPVSLTRDAQGNALFSTPAPAPVQTKAPDVMPERTHRDTLTPFIQRLEDANYRVIMEPRTFEGVWHGDVQNAKGERFALLGSSTTDAPNAREAVLVRLPEGTTLDASVMTQGMPVSLTRDTHGRALFSTPAPTRAHEPSAHRDTMTVPHVPVPVLSQAQWLATQRAEGRDVHALAALPSVVGKLSQDVLELKEGKFYTLTLDEKRVVLVPYDDTLTPHAGNRVLLQAAQPSSPLFVKSLDRGPDLDRGR